MEATSIPLVLRSMVRVFLAVAPLLLPLGLLLVMLPTAHNGMETTSIPLVLQSMVRVFLAATILPTVTRPSLKFTRTIVPLMVRLMKVPQRERTK
jgi:hypothetical protein